MNLENFDQKTSLVINAAFSYASESNFAYLTPLNILEVLIKTDPNIEDTFKYFSINSEEIYSKAKKMSLNAKRKKSNEETLVQGNVIMLIENAQTECKKLNFNKVNGNILLLTLSTDIAPQSKLLLEEYSLTYKKIFQFLKEKVNKGNEEFEFIKNLLQILLTLH